MADHPGDPTKQPPECASRFMPFSDEFPRDPLVDAPFAAGRWTRCSNLYESGGGFDGERWQCDVCGKRYWLDYEEMK